MTVARLAVFRSMHNVRAGERHRPTRAIDVDEAAVAFLRLCDVELGSAWSTDRLTDTRRRLESEARLLHSYAVDAERKAAGTTGFGDALDEGGRARVRDRLASDSRYLAVTRFVEIAREAEASAMTLVYDDEGRTE